jgi:hypothetical protein
MKNLYEACVEEIHIIKHYDLQKQLTPMYLSKLHESYVKALFAKMKLGEDYTADLKAFREFLDGLTEPDYYSEAVYKYFEMRQFFSGKIYIGVDVIKIAEDHLNARN